MTETNTINRKVKVIGCASGWGAQIRDTALGPEATQLGKIINNIYDDGLNISWENIIYPSNNNLDFTLEDNYDALPLVSEVCKRLSNVISNKLNKQEFPIIIGGDHSIAVGTWSAVANHYINHLNEKSIGLIWIDAHMDSHTPDTSHSRAIHGMPLASLLGHGPKELTDIYYEGAKIMPQNLVLIGIRSFETEEQKLLDSLGVKIFYMKDIKERGFNKIWKETITYIKAKNNFFGLSIDLDGFDPSIAPGVGSPENGGILLNDLIQSSIKDLSSDPSLAALEITEYNPNKDQENKTLHLIENIIRLTLLGINNSQ